MAFICTVIAVASAEHTDLTPRHTESHLSMMPCAQSSRLLSTPGTNSNAGKPEPLLAPHIPAARFVTHTCAYSHSSKSIGRPQSAIYAAPEVCFSAPTSYTDSHMCLALVIKNRSTYMMIAYVCGMRSAWHSQSFSPQHEFNLATVASCLIIAC